MLRPIRTGQWLAKCYDQQSDTSRASLSRWKQQRLGRAGVFAGEASFLHRMRGAYFMVSCSVEGGSRVIRKGLSVGVAAIQPLIAQGGSNGVVRVYDSTTALGWRLNQGTGRRQMRPWGMVAPLDDGKQLSVPCVRPLWTSPTMAPTTATTFVKGLPSVIAVATITPFLSVWDMGRTKSLWEAKLPSFCTFLTHRERAVILAGLSSGAVAVVDLREKTGKYSLLCAPLNPGHRHVNGISGIVQDPRSSNRLFTGGVDGHIRCWDLRRGSSLLEIFNKGCLRTYGSLPTLSSSPTDNLLQAGSTALPPTTHPGGVRGLTISDDGLTMVSRGALLRETLIWDVDQQTRATCLPLTFEEDEVTAPVRAAKAEEAVENTATMRSVFFGVEGRRSNSEFLLTGNDDGSLLAAEVSSGLRCAEWRDHLWDDCFPAEDEEGRKGPVLPIAAVSLCADVVRHPCEGYVVATRKGDPCWYSAAHSQPQVPTRICYMVAGG